MRLSDMVPPPDEIPPHVLQYRQASEEARLVFTGEAPKTGFAKFAMPVGIAIAAFLFIKG